MATSENLPSNERLRGAMIATHMNVAQLAEATRVDPKTVQRWLAGRVPQARLRWTICEVLGEEEPYLWPEAGRDAATGSTAEVVGAYANRIDLPLAAWRELFRISRKQIDLLGYALLFLPEQHANLMKDLAEKAQKGCALRICLALPHSPVVLERDREEGLDGGLSARIKTGWTYFEPLLSVPTVEFRAHESPMYNSTFRFDNQMLVTPHLYGSPGYSSPLLRLRRLPSGGVFDRFVAHFEATWESARPVKAMSDLERPQNRRATS